MKTIITFLTILSLSTASFASGKFTEFKVGTLIPSDAKTGFYGGIGFGRMIDDNIGYSFEVNYYARTYTKETAVATSSGQVNTTTIQTEIENATTMIPVFFELNYTGQIAPNLDLRISGGLGYEFMWNSETNHVKGIDDTRFYSGFAWNVGAGLSFPLSRASDVYGELMYHSGSPSRDEGKSSAGLPVRTEVDMSGMAFRVGIRLFTFGF